MDAINYTTARKNFAKTMDKVCDDHEPVIITRENAKPVVMMSLEDYNAIEETAYLLSSPANAKRIRESMKEVEEGNVIEKDLADL